MHGMETLLFSCLFRTFKQKIKNVRGKLGSNKRC